MNSIFGLQLLRQMFGVAPSPYAHHDRKRRVLRDGFRDNRNLLYGNDGRRWKLSDNGTTWRSRGESYPAGQVRERIL